MILRRRGCRKMVVKGGESVFHLMIVRLVCCWITWRYGASIRKQSDERIVGNEGPN